MLKKSTNKPLTPLVIFLLSAAIFIVLAGYPQLLGERPSGLFAGISVMSGACSLLVYTAWPAYNYVNLSEVDTYIETQGGKVIINPLPKEYDFEYSFGTPNPDARARTILVFRYDSTFERGYLFDYKGFVYKLSQADLEYILKKTRNGDQNG